MRIVILSLSVNGAMGQYVQCLCSALGAHDEVTFAGPEHFSYTPENYEWLKFKTGSTRAESARRLLNPFAGARLWRDILQRKPDVVHILTGDSYPWSLLGVQYLRKARVPFACTIHDAQAHSKDFFGSLAQRLRVPVVRAATGLHVHTEEAKCLVSSEKPNRPVAVIPHGSFGSLYTRHKDPSIQREKAILFFGRIEHYKGVDILLRAKKLLDPSWKLLLAGPGRLDETICALIEDTASVEVFNRYLSDAEVAHLFQRASVCALPYRDATQSSVPLISAAFGVPVVASAVGAFRDDVPRVSGLLVPPEDPAALAAAIEKANRSTAHYPTELEFTSLSKDFVQLYSDCIAAGAQGATTR